MMEDALEAAPFTAEHMDALYLDEYADLATTRLAAAPLDNEIVEALERLDPERRRLFLGARFMLAATERFDLLLGFDCEIHQAVMLDYFPDLVEHVLDGASRHLIETVAMTVAGWADEHPLQKEFDAQVQADYAAGKFRLVAAVPRETTAAWLRGDRTVTAAVASRDLARRAKSRIGTPGTSRTDARQRGAGRPGHRTVRSSAASGDSGESDPEGPPPALAGFHAFLHRLLSRFGGAR